MMENVHSKDTAPEMKFRKTLWANGIRFITSPNNLPGKPDILIASKRLAIFIDGDYWHGNQWHKRKLRALEEQFKETTNRDYWLKKIRGNMNRDCSITTALLTQGWTVLRFWESDIEKDLEGCLKMAINSINNALNDEYAAIFPQKTVAEFFAGIGLMRMGLEKQGWSVAFANDIDPQKYEIYKRQFSDEKGLFLLEDVHKLPLECVPNVTLATASFPCNDLSLAGARHGLEGKHSSAFWGFVKTIEAMGSRKPPLILLENVTGFLSSNKGEDFKNALLTLNKLGYSVDAFIIDAARFVPQSRQRLFVVGIFNRDSQVWAIKDQLHFYESDIRPKSLTDFIFCHPEIRWNIRDLPALPANTKQLSDILEDISESSSEWWSRERADYLLNQMSQRHRIIAEQMIAGSDFSYGAVFRRIRNNKSMAELRTDGLAGCLRTPRGGSGRQILFKAGKGNFYVRLLTPRECARLMGADDYEISVPKNQALFGFGDAVCVPVIEWIAKYYLNPVINELMRGQPMQLCQYEEDINL